MRVRSIEIFIQVAERCETTQDFEQSGGSEAQSHINYVYLFFVCQLRSDELVRLASVIQDDNAQRVSVGSIE
jgi:hypothetical protein